MRLASNQIVALTSSLAPFLQNQTGELRLYGSRTNDSLKGGDIDLLLIIEDAATVNHLREMKHYLLSAIKKQLGEQKIDLCISTKDEIERDSFLKMIFPESVLLYCF